MNREDIIQMALDTGFDVDDETTLTSLERFAALVAAAEREACAQVCDALNFVDNGTPAGTRASNRHCAAAIRARSKQ